MKKPEIEIYRFTQPKQYYEGVHTDSIEYIEGSMTGMRRTGVALAYKHQILKDRVMDFEEYRNSVEANTSDTFSEEDYPKEGIRVILYV